MLPTKFYRYIYTHILYQLFMIQEKQKIYKYQKSFIKGQSNNKFDVTTKIKIIKDPQKQIQTIYQKLRENFNKDKLFNTQQFKYTTIFPKQNHEETLSQRNLYLPKINQQTIYNPSTTTRNMSKEESQLSNTKFTEKSMKDIKFIGRPYQEQKQISINKIIGEYKKSIDATKQNSQHKNYEELIINHDQQEKVKNQQKDRVKEKTKILKLKEQKKAMLLKTLEIYRPKFLLKFTEHEQVSLACESRQIISNDDNQKSLSNNKISTQIIRQSKKITYKDLKFQFPDFSHHQFINLIKNYNYLEIGQNHQRSYKAYIGNGNNSFLIKKSLKARGYWQFTDSIQKDVNFVWSQKKNKFLELLDRRKINHQTTKIKNKKVNLQKSSLVTDFLKNRKNQYEYLQAIQNLLLKKHFESYVDNIVQVFIRNPKKKYIVKLGRFLQSKRIHVDNLIIPDPHTIRLHNHIESASSLGNKKGLFFYIKKYSQFYQKNPYQIIPQTIHLSSKQLNKIKSNIMTFSFPCLLKPGEFTNRGKGITIHNSWNTLYEAMLNNQTHENGVERTHIIQKYIMPFLYNNRKFDIRVWVLWNGKQAWWYKQGYIRTSSKDFNIKSTSKYVHLTNDAIQKFCQDYGKYQPGNKLSFNEFQKYLKRNSIKHSFWQQTYPQMKKIAYEVFRIGNFTMDTDNRHFSYELFGLDFLIDQNFKVWLIQVNTNPCLQTSCSLLNRLIPNMIQNLLSIVLDPIFPPPISWRKKINFGMQNFRFQVLYDGYEELQKDIFGNKLQRFETQEDQFQQLEQQTPQ